MISRLKDELGRLAEEIEGLASTRAEVVLFGTEAELELHYVRAARLDARHRRVVTQIAAVETERSLASASQGDDTDHPHIFGVPYVAPPPTIRNG